MLEVFLKTLPFFAVIALGYAAGRRGFFGEAATAHLTKFVFYFALSAMLFRFSANLSLAEVFNWNFMLAYFCATSAVYLFTITTSLWRRQSLQTAAIEAQCGVIGNVGFLGIPMLALLMGEAAIGPIMMVLAVDLIFFGSIVVILITGAQDGRMSPIMLKTIGLGLMKNPMIVSICAGFAWSGLDLPIPAPMNEFITLLGDAATPGALFAIGASLAFKSAERIETAALLSGIKLFMHPAAVAIAALWLFAVEPFAAGVMIAAAALPTAGNVYMIAQHYGVAPQRVSATILISTVVSVLTVSVVIGWIAP